MSLENTNGLNVNQHYGARVLGGAQGEYESCGGPDRRFAVNVDGDGMIDMPVFQVNTAVAVTGIDTTFVTGTVTAVDIGGVGVEAATPSAPVELYADNTGEIVVTGATAGTLIINYKQIAAAPFEA